MLHKKDAYAALEQLSISDWDGIVFGSDVVVHYFNMMSKSQHRIEITRDHVRQVSPVFFFPKNSILSYLFNQKIIICQESGLTFHWLAKYKRQHKKKDHRVPKVLRISDIVAILQLSSVLYLISILVFALEMITPQHEIIRKFLDYFTY